MTESAQSVPVEERKSEVLPAMTANHWATLNDFAREFYFIVLRDHDFDSCGLASCTHLREILSVISALSDGESVVVPRKEIEGLQKEAAAWGPLIPLGGGSYQFVVGLHRTLSRWLLDPPKGEK